MDKEKWIDISQPLHNKTAHWPGDIPFSYHISFSKKETGSVNIGNISTSLHTGTHVDAPFHFSNSGEKIIDLDINVFIGRCLVVHVIGIPSISKEVLKNIETQGVQRILFQTAMGTKNNEFPVNIPHLMVDAIDYLNKLDIKLIGIDLPSVDPLDSKALLIHHQLHKHGIHILENIVLDHIKPGFYDLIALPLPLTEGDGSPVRAVLKPSSQ